MRLAKRFMKLVFCVFITTLILYAFTDELFYKRIYYRIDNVSQNAISISGDIYHVHFA